MPSQPSTGTILVARRELHDLVYRCCRVAHIDAGTATELATQWTNAALVEESVMENVDQLGLRLRADVFESLTRAAAGFLVSEAVLDEAAAASARQSGGDR